MKFSSLVPSSLFIGGRIVGVVVRGSDLALILVTLGSSHVILSRTMSVKRIAGWSSASLLVLIMLVSATPRLSAQDVTLNEELLDNYAWRNLSPDRGGRSIGVTGVIGQPDVAYFGAVGGGLWKTSNGGQDWNSITDFKINSSSVGAVEVSETNPDLIFIGTGETCIRGNVLPGDGVYRSRDAGETWEHVGFSDSHGISKIRIHPTNPDIIWVASFGKYSAESEERGVFKSTDGDDTWERVLFANGWSGAIDIAVDLK